MQKALQALAEHRRPLLAVLLTTAAGIAVLILVLGGPDDDDPLSGSAGEVVDVMNEFERAAQRREFLRICNELFTREAREAAGGSDCPQLLSQSAQDVRDIQVQLESIVVRGNFATARVKASADGQRAATDTVRFLRVKGRYRIASLSP